MVIRRKNLLAPALIVLLITACNGSPPGDPTPERHDVSSGRTSSVTCHSLRAVFRRVQRGFVPDRSGDLALVEQPYAQHGTRHSTAWPYTQTVPLFFYGPGRIASGVESPEAVTLADVAPTLAAILGIDLPTHDGNVLREALTFRKSPPRLVVVIVWDGGGTNVLRRWSKSWPNLQLLRGRGAFFSSATAGSAPSITPPVHATLGTGSFPRRHGIPDIKMRFRNAVIDPWRRGSPRFLETKTLAEVWDEANRNEPKIGVIARDFWHVGMIGHGAFLPDADRDIAILDDLETATSFETNDSFYRLPDYVRAGPELDAAIHAVDSRDGVLDQTWLGNLISDVDGRIRATPAWPIFQTHIVKEVILREDFGRDRMADLLFVNYKSTDLAGHQWNVVEPEVRAVLREQDRQLDELVGFLDERVGRRRYVLVLTADHGMTPYPRVQNRWSIDGVEVTRDVEAAFGGTAQRPVVKSNRGYQLILNKRHLRAAGHSVDDVAAFLRDYEIEDNAAEARSFPASFAGRRHDKLYLLALPASDLDPGDAPPSCSRSGS